MPERRAPPPPKPAAEVTVVRRVSRKVQIPGNEPR